MKLNLYHCYRGPGLILLCLLLSAVGAAQQAITGTITDAESGDPLIGASVVVTGSTTGTVTDFDGNFELNVPAEANSITVSYTGYGTQEIAITEGQTAYTIELTSGELLQEVVVVGYGAVKKQDLTGAVTVLSEEDFNKGVITSPEQLIQGRAAGVQVTQTSGEPGAGVNFRIRGTSSVRSNNNPLFVVDGVPLSGESTAADGSIGGLGNTTARNPLNFLNPSDIESINVLKDASATAIYGSRGANGVVLITTKSGASGQGVLTYETTVGLASISKRYDVLGRDAFLDAYRSFNGDAATETLDGGADVNWQDEIFRTALTHTHNLSFGGGDEGGAYRFSASYMDQEGIVDQSGLQRISARFNGNKRFIDDRLGLSTQITVSDIHDDNVPITTNSGFEGDLLGNILKANPTQTILNPDGTYNQVSQTEPNPLALLNLYEGYTNTLRLLGNVSAEVGITDALTFKSVYGIDRSFSTRADAQSPLQRVQGIEGIGRATLNDLRVSNNLWENYFTLRTDLGGAIAFEGLLGYSYQSFERAGKTAGFSNFRRITDPDIMINNVSAADQINGAGAFGNSFRTQDELQSYFGRINFDIADKYLLTATLRADGSTRFANENQYGLFPSFAFKWRLLEEGFAPESFSDLGLRVGYGVTGNQELPHNQYQLRRQFVGYGYNAGTTGLDGGRYETIAFDNENLQWESTSQINAGIDWGINNNRLSGSIDYYYKSTSDLLIQTRSAQPAVQEFVWENLDADVINEGVELAVNYVAVDRGSFTWDVIFNVAYNNNVVRNFDRLINTGDISGQGLTGAYAQRIAEGQPLYAFFLREFGGYDEEGNSIYPNGDVQEFTGQSPLPKVTGGLTNQLLIGNVDINLFFTGQFGFYIYNNTANAFFTAGALSNGRNVSSDVVGNGEGRLNAPDVSTRFVEKGDFVRLQNASIGYTIPTREGILSNMRISLTGQNLFVITGYSGQDPEVSISKPLNGVPSIGIDYTAYPRARTVTFGLNASF
ncbi:SusC/RagA family TonB-linked outer membrane protein [Lewinella sp. IMCC34191]|uniref:SusC/RagA family TonB-linked outer membrane protein n=1 Tax=Lewinella sp. IMCC34191 TaxID=2259172 RepID=UPI000E27EC20|nr:SusC/RagA family TonB-linked outer membrane protein [Lewinella sp. IMCC34191]